MKDKTITLRIKKAMPGYAEDSLVNDIEVDSNNTPKEKFWRDRLKDAKIDDCVEIVTDSKATDSKNTDLKKSEAKK